MSIFIALLAPLAYASNHFQLKTEKKKFEFGYHELSFNDDHESNRTPACFLDAFLFSGYGQQHFQCYSDDCDKNLGQTKQFLYTTDSEESPLGFASTNFSMPQPLYAYYGVVKQLQMSWNSDGKDVIFYAGDTSLNALCSLEYSEKDPEPLFYDASLGLPSDYAYCDHLLGLFYLDW